MKAIRAGCGGVEAVYSSQAIFHPRFVPCLGARVTLHEKLTIKERFQYGPVTTFVGEWLNLRTSRCRVSSS
jgi:hypothetical protein